MIVATPRIVSDVTRFTLELSVKTQFLLIFSLCISRDIILPQQAKVLHKEKGEYFQNYLI